MKLDSEQSHSMGDAIKRQRLLREALGGDILFVLSPATVAPSPTSAAFTRDVFITVENAAGEVHEWFNEVITTGVAIADTSTAGTATIPSTTLTVVDGRVTVVVSGDAQDWLAAETDTLTVAAYTGFAGQTLGAKTSVETVT